MAISAAQLLISATLGLGCDDSLSFRKGGGFGCHGGLSLDRSALERYRATDFTGFIDALSSGLTLSRLFCFW